MHADVLLQTVNLSLSFFLSCFVSTQTQWPRHSFMCVLSQSPKLLSFYYHFSRFWQTLTVLLVGSSIAFRDWLFKSLIPTAHEIPPVTSPKFSFTSFVFVALKFAAMKELLLRLKRSFSLDNGKLAIPLEWVHTLLQPLAPIQSPLTLKSAVVGRNCTATALFYRSCMRIQFRLTKQW